MPAWLIAALSRLVFSRIGAWVIQAMVAMGIGLALKEFAVDPLMDYVANAWTGLPADLVAWMGVLNIDIYVVAILSAFAASTITSVVLRKLP